MPTLSQDCSSQSQTQAQLTVGQGEQARGHVAPFLGQGAEGSGWCGRRSALRGKQHPGCVLAHDPSGPCLTLCGERRYVPACLPTSASHARTPAQPLLGNTWQLGQPVPILLWALRGHLCIARSSAGTARPAAPSNRVGSHPSFGLSHERSWGPSSPRPGQAKGVTGRQGSSV